MAIPSESDLAREFGASPGTIRKALHLLESELLITRRQGRAPFVNDQSFALYFNGVRGCNSEPLKGNIETTEGVPDEKERSKLCLQMGDRVYRTRGVRLNEKAFTYEERSIPAMFFPQLSDMSSLSHSIVCLAQKHGILLGMAEERISIGEAPPYVAEALGVASSSPLALLDRVVQTIDGRAVEWRVAWSDLGKNHCFDVFASGKY